MQCALFDCYTFVHIGSISRRSAYDTPKTPGVLGFVGIRGVALPIPDKEIEDIQTLLAQNVTCALYPFVREGQRVRIRGGCLDGVEGLLVSKNSDRSWLFPLS